MSPDADRQDPEPALAREPVLGYLDSWSYRGGDEMKVMLSAAEDAAVELSVIRFVDGSPAPGTAPAPSVEMEKLRQVVTPGLQDTAVGSWFEAPIQLREETDLSLSRIAMWAMFSSDPTDEATPLACLGRADSGAPDVGIFVGPDRRIEFRVHGDTVVKNETSLTVGVWHHISVEIADGAAQMAITARSALGDSSEIDPVTGEMPDSSGTPDVFRLAGWDPGEGGLLDVRVSRPEVDFSDDRTGGAAQRLSWHFGFQTESWKVPETGRGQSVGRLHNSPDRLVPGPAWEPLEQPTPTPQSHDAVHFRVDDVGDLGWSPSARITLPEDTPSGVYGIRLRSEDQEMHVPFAVRGRSRVTFLMPTLTYLSYANHRMFTGRGDVFGYITDHDIRSTDLERLVLAKPALGRSIYDLHEDGSGVSRVSRARPLVNLEPGQLDWLGDGPHHFAADLYIVGWLERTGVDYSVMVDDDLHFEGLDSLDGCEVLITGSHPEYWTAPMMRALREYLRSGRHLMYLGANGFYWVTSLSPDGANMEVRRGFAGSRAWTSNPGETHHAFDGELGGLWRNRGFGPHTIGGVGMASQGWGASVGYRRLPDSADPRVAHFFDGVGDDELIGDFGHLAGGAAGYEIDRLDHRWGSPRQALRLATSETFSDYYQLTVEEVENMTPGYGGSKIPEVRADMVWYETEAGSQVFSTGSIAWASALGWNQGDNNVARITTNVLHSFLPADG